MTDEKPGDVIVMRNPNTGRPVAVPDEIVSQAEREYRAFKMSRAGKDWHEIAIHEQYPSAQAAAAAVKRYLDEGAAVVADFRRTEAISMEVARLNALQSAFWDAAQAGDTKAGALVFNIIMGRVKLQKLDVLISEDEATQARTVVVASDDGYADSLREIAES